jgi:hypothetical protein
MPCYLWLMLCEARASTGVAWSWQPGRGLRASESVALGDGERLHRTLKRISKARALLDAQEAAALREAQRIRLWEQFGYTSLVDYMEHELGYTARSAVERLRVAKAIEELPAVEAALEQGALSFSGARELTRIVTPATQEAWLDAAQDKNVRQIEEMVSGHKLGDLPSDPVDEQLRTKVLRFEVKLDTAALVREYQKKRAKQLGQLIDDDLLIREVFQFALDRLVEQRRDAVQVVNAANAMNAANAANAANAPAVSGTPAVSLTSHAPRTMPSNPQEASSDLEDPAREGGAITARTRDVASRPRYQVSISTCDVCKRGWLDAAGTSTLLGPAELATALCDCEEIGRVDHAGPVVRKRNTIPPAVKRKALARDRHRCQVPGCRSTNIDVHHLHARALGGTHDEWNLITLCEAHHLAIHRGTLVAIGRAPNVTFTFVAANRFTIESRVVETKRELERRGIPRIVASAAVNAVRTHVGTQPLSSDEWLTLALARCPGSGA